MNAKEAREIVNGFDDSLNSPEKKTGFGPQHILPYTKAQGYLDCYEQVKPLVEALEEFTLPPYKDSDLPSLLETIRARSEAVLSRFRKAQGEE